jgi:hypothetical protein
MIHRKPLKLVRLMYLSASDSVSESSPSPSPPSSFTHTRRCIGPHNETSPMTQPVRLMYIIVSDGSYEPTPSPSPHFSFTHEVYRSPHNPTYVRSLDPSVLTFSLSLYRHPSICILFSSHFTSYIKQQHSHVDVST